MTLSIPPYSTLHDRIQAVLSKDKNASAAFVVALISHGSSILSHDSADPVKGLTKSHCRPDCPSIPLNVSPHDLVFFNSSEEALKNNFKPCLECHPDVPVQINLSLIQSTVNAVNASLNIDICTDSTNEYDSSSSPLTSSIYKSFKSSITSSKSFVTSSDCAVTSLPSSPEDLSHDSYHRRAPSMITPSVSHKNGSADFWDSKPRRASIANGYIHAVAAAVNDYNDMEGHKSPPSKICPLNQAQSSPAQFFSISNPNTSFPRARHISRPSRHSDSSIKRKNDRQSRGEGEHARLVNEACMHIAAAAAAAAAQAATEEGTALESSTGRRRSPSMARSSSTDPARHSFKPQRKKRRGGILGFKELAAKAGLSPWHFHRVFRSVTGLTPKAYGDACWNTVTNLPLEELLKEKTSEVTVSSPIKSGRAKTVTSAEPTSPLQISNNTQRSIPASIASPITSTPAATSPMAQTSKPVVQSTPAEITFPGPNLAASVNAQATHDRTQLSINLSFAIDDPSFENVQTWPEVNSLNVLQEIPNIENIPAVSQVGESIISSLEPPLYMMNLAKPCTSVDSVSSSATDQLANFSSSFVQPGFTPAHVNTSTTPVSHFPSSDSALISSMSAPQQSSPITSPTTISGTSHMNIDGFYELSNDFSALENLISPNGPDFMAELPASDSTPGFPIPELDIDLGHSQTPQTMETSLDTPVFDENNFHLDNFILDDSKTDRMGLNSLDICMFGNSTVPPPCLFFDTNASANARHNVMGSTISANQFLSLPTNGANTPIMLDDTLTAGFY